MYFGTLTNMADNLQNYKYAVQMVTHHIIKHVSLCLNPLKVIMDPVCSHQSIWKGSTPVFMGKEYSGLSKTAYTT